MSETIKFIVNGVPIPKARPRIIKNKTTGRVHAFTPKSTKDYERLVSYAAKAHMRGKDILESPIKATINIYMPIPKSLPKAKREALENCYHTSRPDKDNIIKAIYDALNGITFTDDKLIVEEVSRKLYSINPRVEIKLEVIE